jgi:hypothetical protein
MSAPVAAWRSHHYVFLCTTVPSNPFKLLITGSIHEFVSSQAIRLLRNPTISRSAAGSPDPVFSYTYRSSTVHLDWLTQNRYPGTSCQTYLSMGTIAVCVASSYDMLCLLDRFRPLKTSKVLSGSCSAILYISSQLPSISNYISQLSPSD